MSSTRIDYLTDTWSPVIGCTHSGSPGCDRCWARELHDMRHRARLAGKHLPVQYAKPFSTIQLREHWLAEPLSWRKPRKRVGVCFGGDLFHADVPDSFIDRVFAVMALCPQHTFLLLTKRAERMRAYLALAADCDDITVAACEMAGRDFDFHNEPRLELPLSNVWLGVTAEDQPRADERIPLLLQTPAAHRWVSLEPLLGPVDLRPWLCYTSVHEANTIGKHAVFSGGDGIAHRLGGSRLEDCGEAIGQMERRIEVDSMRSQAGGTRNGPGEIPPSIIDDRRGAHPCDGASIGVSSLLRRDSAGLDDQPQERQQDRQSPQESRSSNVLREPETCVSERAGGRVRGAEPRSEVGERGDCENPSGVCRRRDYASGVGGQVRGCIPNDLKDCQGREPCAPVGEDCGLHGEEKAREHRSDGGREIRQSAVSFVIAGCESGPKRWPAQDAWFAALASQCRAAGVPFYLKQRDINGRIDHRGELDGVVYRQMPEGL